MIKVINLSKLYKTKKNENVYALKNINLEFPSRGLVFVLGESGSGKTTLLNILGGIDVQTSGEFTFLNKEFTYKKKQ